MRVDGKAADDVTRPACSTATSGSPPGDPLPSLHLPYHNIIEFLPDATFVIDREGRVIAWNRAIEEMSGVSKEEILGKAGYAYAVPFYGEPRPILIDLILGSDRAFEEKYDFIIKRGTTIFGEVFVPRTYGGKGAYLWGTASPLWDDQGHLVGAIQSIRDITERKQAQQDLEDSEERLKILFECAPDAYYLHDLEGNFVDGNKTAEEISGYPRGEMIGKNFLSLGLIPPEERRKAREILARSALGQPSGPDEFTLTRKDGERIIVEVRTFPTKIKGQTLVLSIGRDITARKQAEEALRESERQLRCLSSKLLSAQEEERKRIARELHDSIGSSLSAIKFGLECILEQNTPEPVTTESLRHLVALTQTTIEESRRIITDLRPSLLDDLGIIATIHWFCRQCRGIYRNVRIETSIAVEESEVPQPTKIIIFRILQEALHNATKYSRAGRIGITLARDAHALVLTIEDDGAGFDVHAAACSGERGLGLDSMRERAELSGGTFRIESVPGVGTALRAAWPL